MAAGRTTNGVFAARIMWGTMREVVDKVEAVFGGGTGSALDLLQRAFGTTRFIYLEREDAVAQAVSWLRAEQTNIWFEATTSRRADAVEQPRFDERRIEALHQLIIEHNTAWRRWFAAAGVEPHHVRYEDLDRDPMGTTRAVLDSLGIALPPGRAIEVRHRRLADELNAEWIDRYRAAGHDVG